jgi:serine/threonine protein kinase
MNPFEHGSFLAPGLRVIEQLSRTRRLDTFEVWSEERACSCVAKTLRPDRRHDEAARAALENEGRLLMAVTHPHIVRGYEVVEDPELIVVMETLDGETLAHLMDRRPKGLDADETAWLGIHLTSALRYLHHRGVLHLDVKPSNIVAEAGRAKLIDLSLARPPGRYHSGIGTWSHLSPEQARGGGLGPPADVWGVGTVLYEAVTGGPAFEYDGSWTDDSGSSKTWDSADRPEARYPQLEHQAAPILKSARAPGAMADAIISCLEPDPDDRPTLEELAERLAPFASKG